MKFGIDLFVLVILTLIWSCGISGCSHQGSVTATTSETRVKHTESGDRHVPHAEAKTNRRETDEHGEHAHHRQHGHKSDSHGQLHHGHEHGDEAPPQARIKVGDKVPDFSLRTLEGKSIPLSQLQKDMQRTASGIVVLSFWCSTCHSCRDMEHLLAKLNKDYEGQAAVFALGVNFDETGESVKACLKENGLVLPVVLDPSGDSAELFGVTRTTTTVVIDSNGLLRYCGQFRGKGGGSAEAALKAVLTSQEVAVKTTPHHGCLIMRK